jgi:hypothetical protein
MFLDQQHDCVNVGSRVEQEFKQEHLPAELRSEVLWGYRLLPGSAVRPAQSPPWGHFEF